MPTRNEIIAIKTVRERTGLSLGDARELVEEIAPLFQQDTDEIAALRATCQSLHDKAEVARRDLQTTIRLVEYFVRHPSEFDVWKAASEAAQGE